MRANVIWPAANTQVRFVGGVPSRHYPEVNLERVYHGEVLGEPVFSDGATWIRVYVIGVGDHLLVPVENLRP